MAWIEQTKKASGKSGGPQYYLQDLNEPTKRLLRDYKRRPVKLWTPYGVVNTGMEAVSKSIGSVGHDRIQTGGRAPNVAEQVASWYALNRSEIETIEFADSFDNDSFVIRPTHIKFFGNRARRVIYPGSHPLTFVAGTHSPLLLEHIKNKAGLNDDWIAW